MAGQRPTDGGYGAPGTPGTPDPYGRPAPQAPAAAPARARAVPLPLFAAVLALTATVTAGLVLLGLRWVSAPDDLPGPVRPAAATVTPEPAAIASTRLVVAEPRRLLDTARTGNPGPGTEVAVPLPRTAPDTAAVLLQLSMLDAAGPGLVTVHTDVEEVPALRLPAKGAQTSATVVAVLGPERSVRLVTEGGGRLLVDLVGTFEPAERSAAGRIVPVPATTVLTLRPKAQGHDAVIDVAALPVLRDAGPASAVLLRVAGDVGTHGGHVAVGPPGRSPNQQVFWGATAGADRTRNGFLVVPVAQGRIRLEYRAGTELRVQVVGVVSGEGAQQSAAGLTVPLPAEQAPSVRVAAAGRAAVRLVPAGGLAGVSPDRVEAVLTTLAVTGDAPGPVSVVAPGEAGRSIPDLSAAPKTRSALALAAARDGTVTVTSEAGAAVVLTARLLILR